MGDTARLRLIQDYRSSKHSVWGIARAQPRQNFAMNLLLDPDIDHGHHPRACRHGQGRC
ncbi:MAG: hypothetical protein WDO12_12615 [Pseudomonadota bacterium]